MGKKEVLVLYISIFLLSIGIAHSAPNVTFNYQYPSDLNLTNFIGPEGMNISYNISVSNITYSSIKLYFKSNSTQTNVMYYQNGTAVSGYFGTAYTVNSSNVFTWRLTDNYVLPGTYNYGEVTLENTIHSSASLTSNNDYLAIELLNVSNARQYSFFEIMINRSSGNGNLRAYYCNSSYNFASSPATNANCYNFYNLLSNTYNHVHSSYSSHMLMPFTINTTSGKIGTIAVSSTSYFLMRGRASNTWNYYYISNSSRTNAFKTSINGGTSWSAQTFTVDAHLHQFGTNTSLFYYACANDTSNNQNCSSVRQDLFELAGLPPTSPYVSSPASQDYYKNQQNISINYTASMSPNDYAIAYYNISLLNTDESFNQTITANTNSLIYSWNASSVSDGEYIIKVTSCDILNQCSSGFSENFTLSYIDTTYPLFSTYWDNNGTLSNSGTGLFNVTITNSNGTVFLEINGENITAANVSDNFSANYTFTTNGTYEYKWHAWGNGLSSNYNQSDLRNYTVTYSAPSEVITTNSGNSRYLKEVDSSDDILELELRMTAGTTKELEISNDKDTGIDKIIIKAEEYLNGEIKIESLDNLPKGCEIPSKYANSKIYRILQIDSTIDSEEIDEVSLVIGIGDLWKSRNKIKSITGIKCLPEFENLNIEQDRNDYTFTSNGFSTWLILGIKVETIALVDKGLVETIQTIISEPQETVEYTMEEQTVEVIEEPKTKSWKKILIPALLVSLLFGLFIFSKPKKPKTVQEMIHNYTSNLRNK